MWGPGRPNKLGEKMAFLSVMDLPVRVPFPEIGVVTSAKKS